MSSSILARLKNEYDGLSPVLQQAARWTSDHPADVCFLSMREQARLAEVVPPTMTRLAQALGFASFREFQDEFRTYVSWGAADFSARAKRLQHAEKRTHQTVAHLEHLQEANLETLSSLNDGDRIARVATLLKKAKTVAYLGFRSSHSVALHAHYLHSMLLGPGVLLADGYGTLTEMVEALQPGTVLVAISLAPYSRQTVAAVQQAAAKKLSIVAITDSQLSPLARVASERLLFEAASNSFFHSLVAAHALVECVMADVAARGGKSVLARLKARETLLHDTGAYWSAPRSR